MKRQQQGVVYLWALFAVTVAGVVLAGTGQIWQITTQREKEKELLFIGEQFRKAIMSYYNNPLTGIRQYPEKIEDLLEDKRGAVPIRHLRKIFIDPMTLTDEWGLVIEEVQPQPQPQANQRNNPASAAGLMGANASPTASSASPMKGIAGVYSLSTQKPRKKDNFPDQYASFSDAETYQDWQFVFKQDSGGGANNQQGQQSGAGRPGASPSSSPFGGVGAAKPGGGSGQGGFGGQGSGFGGQGGASPATGQNPFAR
ncbi:MAG: hypothetical protein KDF59_04925 [Nitrosomonas sp.]|nr:hypothetical protein [Nitrosomonas sp.]